MELSIACVGSGKYAVVSRWARIEGSETLKSLSLRLKDLLGPVTRVKKKPPSHAPWRRPPAIEVRSYLAMVERLASPSRRANPAHMGIHYLDGRETWVSVSTEIPATPASRPASRPFHSLSPGTPASRLAIEVRSYLAMVARLASPSRRASPARRDIQYLFILLQGSSDY